MTADLEEVGHGPRIPNCNRASSFASDVLEPEAKASIVGISDHRADDESGELHLTCAACELTRRDRRIAAPGDRRVQEEDGQDRSHRERDHEPRGTRFPCHGESLDE